MTAEQIKSLYRRQLSTHQSLAPVIEAIIEHLAASEKVPAESANVVAPREKQAEASMPLKGKGKQASPVSGEK